MPSGGPRKNSGGARPRSGPPPKPSALRVLEGNPSKRPLPKREPKPAVRLPRPPDELSAKAKKEYYRLGGALKRMGVMTEVDGMALAGLCQAWAQWLELQPFINAVAPVRTLTPPAKGIEVNPLYRPLRRAAGDAWQEYVRLLAEFGLTPASRTRVEATPQAMRGKDSDERLKELIAW